MTILYLCDKYFYEEKMSRVRFHSIDAISKQCNLIYWGPNWEGWNSSMGIAKNIEMIEQRIDLIVVYKPLDMGNDWNNIDIPICLRYNETYDLEWTEKEIVESNSSLIIFHHENDTHGSLESYRKRFPKITFEYIPHSAEKSIFNVDNTIDKLYDILLVGAVGHQSKLGQHYPLRDRMHSLIEKFKPKYNVGISPRPGSRFNDAWTDKYAKEFAAVINSSKICITDSGAPKSRFGKYVEIPMCGSVIAGDIPNDDSDSFKKFVIEINMDMTDEEIISKITEYLDNPEKLNNFRIKGLEWSKEYTQEKYAVRFLEESKKYLAKNNTKRFDEYYLTDYFNKLNYDYKKDLEQLTNICMLTKTRLDNSMNEGELKAGCEQPFLVKAIAQNIKAEKVFEIGTGRGTACYSLALEESITEICTTDIIDNDKKYDTSISYRPATASNTDIFEMVKYKEKNKIKMLHRTELYPIIDSLEGQYDLAFIDGEHNVASIIWDDYHDCVKLLKPGGIILFDDYNTTKFEVKGVVDKILEQNPEYKAELVYFSGHIFEQEKRLLTGGIMVVRT